MLMRAAHFQSLVKNMTNAHVIRLANDVFERLEETDYDAFIEAMVPAPNEHDIADWCDDNGISVFKWEGDWYWTTDSAKGDIVDRGQFIYDNGLDSFDSEEEAARDAYEQNDGEFHPEFYQHFEVSGWLMHRLEEVGEHCSKIDGDYFWHRQACGQAIYMDLCMIKVWREHQLPRCVEDYQRKLGDWCGLNTAIAKLCAVAEFAKLTDSLKEPLQLLAEQRSDIERELERLPSSTSFQVTYNGTEGYDMVSA